MLDVRQINPVARAVGVITAVAVLATATTLALTSQATLADNSINSVTTDLVVNNDAGDTDFNESEQGFAFNDLVPGTESAPRTFQLRNQGEVPLDVSVQITGESPLPSGVDGNDITFKFTNTSATPGAQGPGGVVTATWAELTPTGGVQLIDEFAANPSASADYQVTVTIDPSVEGESVSISSFDFTFTGNTEEEL